MIKVVKPTTVPQILIDNQATWTDALVNAINHYGSYKDIPKDEKDRLLAPYRHKDIQEPLFLCSYGKCAFCESSPGESGNIEVEHFAPKSIYHDRTFDWDNFLPVCRKCNEAKRDHDTIVEPIVNPCIDDPEQYFDYDSIGIVSSPNSPDATMSNRTIEVCNLECPRLFKARSELLCNLKTYERNLKDWLTEYKESSTPIKQRNRIIKLIDSVCVIENLTNRDQKFSAFCKSFLRKSRAYEEAKQIIDDFQRAI